MFSFNINKSNKKNSPSPDGKSALQQAAKTVDPTCSNIPVKFSMLGDKMVRSFQSLFRQRQSSSPSLTVQTFGFHPHDPSLILVGDTTTVLLSSSLNIHQGSRNTTAFAAKLESTDSHRITGVSPYTSNQLTPVNKPFDQPMDNDVEFAPIFNVNVNMMKSIIEEMIALSDEIDSLPKNQSTMLFTPVLVAFEKAIWNGLVSDFSIQQSIASFTVNPISTVNVVPDMVNSTAIDTSCCSDTTCALATIINHRFSSVVSSSTSLIRIPPPLLAGSVKSTKQPLLKFQEHQQRNDSLTTESTAILLTTDTQRLSVIPSASRSHPHPTRHRPKGKGAAARRKEKRETKTTVMSPVFRSTLRPQATPFVPCSFATHTSR